MTVRWVIQQNLGKADDVRIMMDACRSMGCETLGVDVIPFSSDLPDIPGDRPTVFYGATGFINSVHLRGSWRPGAFYDPQSFRYSRYLFEYGERMLNSSVEFTTLDLFKMNGRDPDELVFVRPDRDLKEFAGEVVRVGDFVKWKERISHGGYTIGPDCPIVVAEPVGISCEWRTFIVNGKCVTGSQYRRRQILDVRESLPDRVRAFAEDCAKLWSPAPVYALDIAQSGDELYVLELGCFNSAGMYACDIKKLIHNITQVVSETFKNDF